MYKLKFIGLQGTELKHREEEVKASSVQEAIAILKTKYSVVQRVKHLGVYV